VLSKSVLRTRRGIKIEADELSSSYVLDTFSALAQLDSGETQFDTRSSVPAKKPHFAFGATLSLARQCHGLGTTPWALAPQQSLSCAPPHAPGAIERSFSNRYVAEQIREAADRRREHAEAIAEAGAKFRGRLTASRPDMKPSRE
jgi:hypothetical protein